MSLTYIAGFDGTRTSQRAVGFAVELGRATGAEVTAAHVYPPAPAVDDPDSELSQDLQVDVARVAEFVLAALDIPDVARKALCADSPAHGLHVLAEETDASLICVGATHHGLLGRLLPGSVGLHLLHGAPCAVAVVPAETPTGPIRTVGVAYDGRAEARTALAEAERLARTLGARLVLLDAFDPPTIAAQTLTVTYDFDTSLRGGRERHLEEAAEQISGPDVETRVLRGPAGKSIAKASRGGIDLLVCGSRGYGPVRSVLLGSVSRHLVDHAACPVLVVPRSGGALITDGRTPEAAGREPRGGST